MKERDTARKNHGLLAFRVDSFEQAGLNTSEIYGYNHEELTHAAVVTQIAAGSADVGMGILSAARLCGLGFIPLCLEQYDLLIPDYA